MQTCIYICLFIYSNVFKVWFWFSLWKWNRRWGALEGCVTSLQKANKNICSVVGFDFSLFCCVRKNTIHYLQCLGAETSYWYLQHCGLEFLLWFLFFHVGVGLSWLCCQFIFLRCCLHLSCSTPPKNGKSKQKQQKHKATQPRNQKPQE